MSDYIIVSACQILILKGATHAQLGVVRALLLFPAPRYDTLSLRYSDFVKKVWSVRNAIQAVSVGVGTLHENNT